MVDPDGESPEPAPKGKKQNKESGQKPPAQAEQPKQQQQPQRQVIDEKSVQLLRGMFEQNGIDEKFVCNLYKIASIEATSQTQYAHIMSHIEEIKKRQEAK